MGRLILTRKIGQAIVIDGPGPSVVRLVRTSKGSARLIIESPAETKVDREEIRAKKEQKP